MTSKNDNTTASTSTSAVEEHDKLMEKMDETRKKWMDDDDEEQDDTDRFLQDAIDLAVKQGKGWGPGEKEAYMKQILDDDFIPPIFAESQEELERSGLAEAFSALHYDDSPEVVMLDFKKKGGDAFVNGKRNETNNVQYFRDAVNHYYEAFAWAQKVEPLEHRIASKSSSSNDNNDDDTTKGKGLEPRKDDAPDYSEKELDEMKSTLLANAALAHMQLKNWGHVRDDSKKVRFSFFMLYVTLVLLDPIPIFFHKLNSKLFYPPIICTCENDDNNNKIIK